MTTDVDYSQPLATLLRATVMEIHDSVANSRGAKALGEGKLPKQEYVRLLMMLWHIYRLVAAFVKNNIHTETEIVPLSRH